MTLTSRHNVQALDSDDPDIQAIDSDDPDVQAQHWVPWEWLPWHPETTFRPLTVMTNSQALDSDDPDIQTPRSGPW